MLRTIKAALLTTDSQGTLLSLHVLNMVAAQGACEASSPPLLGLVSRRLTAATALSSAFLVIHVVCHLL
jgi:hypothetical protein